MIPTALLIIEKYKSKLCGEKRVHLKKKGIQRPVYYEENGTIARVFWTALLEITQHGGLKNLLWVLKEYTFTLKMF